MFLILVLLGLFLDVLTTNAVGYTSDKNFQFQNDYLHDGYINPSLIESVNYRNQTSYSEHYNGSESFENEVVDTISTAIDFIDSDVSDASCEFRIVASSNNHEMLLRMRDNSGTGNCDGYHNFDSSQESGTIEFWYQTSTTSYYAYFHLKDTSNNDIAGFTFRNGGNIHDISGDLLQTYVANKWYLIRIDFECGNGGYLGLSPDTYNLIIGGIEYSDLSFGTATTSITKIWISTANALSQNNHYTYYDAFGFSWDGNYDLGDNYFPNKTVLTDLEVDKFEFQYDESANVLNLGDDNVLGWVDMENDIVDNDVVNVYDSDDLLDKGIRIHKAQKGFCGINQTFDTTINGIIEFDIQLDITSFGYPDSEIYIELENSGVMIFKLKLNGTTGIVPIHDKLANLSYYYDGVYNLLESNFIVRDNDNLNISIISVKNAGYGFLTVNGNEYVIYTSSTCDFLSSVNIYGINDNNIVYKNMDFEIDYVRIIIDGTSLSSENTPKNVYVITTNSINMNQYCYFEIEFDINYFNNVSILLNNEIQLVNYYELGYEGNSNMTIRICENIEYNGAFLIISNSSQWSIINFKWYAIKMINSLDSNDYFILEHSLINTNITNAYFYTLNNQLYYSVNFLNTSQESLQGSFLAIDINLYEYQLEFSHLISGIDYVSTQIKFQTYTNINYTYQSSKLIQYESYTFGQDILIENMHIVISDGSAYYTDKISSGYISVITLEYYENYVLSILTEALFTIFPAILIMLLPPLLIQLELIYNKKKKDKELDNPLVFNILLLLFSLIPIISGMLPSWFFFIMLFSIFTAIRIGGKNDNDNDN